MRLRHAERATHQLAEIKDYIALRNPDAARRVIREIRAAVKGLVDFPEAHRQGPAPDFRELVVARLPYVVIYRVSDERIDVLGVFHAARDPSVRSRP